MLTRKLHIVLWLSLLAGLQAGGQTAVTGLPAFIKSAAFSSLQLKYPKQVGALYSINDNRYCWLDVQSMAAVRWLAGTISHADSLGLVPLDYQPSLFAAYASHSFLLHTQNDSLIAEVSFTDAAIHFMHDVMAGNRQEPLAFNGLQYTAECDDIPPLLNRFLVNGNWDEMVGLIEPKTAACLAVKKQLNDFRKMAEAPGFRDAIVTSAKVDTGNHPLMKRLYQLGCLPADTVPPPALLKSKLQQAQELLSVLHDGVLRNATLAVLNVPLKQRIEELRSTLNALRWLQCTNKNRHVIVVNIPSANLLLYEEGKVVLESRVIVGKKSTPTPALASSITEVVLYAYWNVPDKIARKELLPIIKRNRAYLSINNFQVLNLQGRVVDPQKVNWQAIKADNFPYRLRQSTGCDNSLGLVKLYFDSPFGVYLHDTPWKMLFGFNNRYFSHGCMRLQKAREVARFVVSANTLAVDTISEENCLKNQAPIAVPATEAIPVFVLYHTAWVDSAAMVRFYGDPYNKIRIQLPPASR